MAQGRLTFLQLCNRVLMRLGKTQVTTAAAFDAATGDSWPGIVKDMVNDAQGEVAKEHDWSTLYLTSEFTTSSREYDLAASYSDFTREYTDLVDVTTRRVLTPVHIRDIDQADPGLDSEGTPIAYAIDYPSLVFDRTPTALTYRIGYVARPTALTTSTSTSTLPEFCDMPIIWWAVWQLQASREDAQDSGENARAIYTSSLARAIGQDRRRSDFVYVMQPVTVGRAGPKVPSSISIPDPADYWDGGP